MQSGSRVREELRNVQATNAAAASGATFPLNVTSIPTKAVYPYTQQWSLSVQREVSKGMVAQLAYVGTKGTHLTAVRDLNQLQPLSNGLNPFGPGQPITASVCQSGANNGGFFVGGLNSGTQPADRSLCPALESLRPATTAIPICSLPVPAIRGSPIRRILPRRNSVLARMQVRPYPGFSNIISVENIAGLGIQRFARHAPRDDRPIDDRCCLYLEPFPRRMPQIAHQRTSPTRSTSTRTTPTRISTSGTCSTSTTSMIFPCCGCSRFRSSCRNG